MKGLHQPHLKFHQPVLHASPRQIGDVSRFFNVRGVFCGLLFIGVNGSARDFAGDCSLPSNPKSNRSEILCSAQS